MDAHSALNHKHYSKCSNSAEFGKGFLNMFLGPAVPCTAAEVQEERRLHDPAERALLPPPHRLPDQREGCLKAANAPLNTTSSHFEDESDQSADEAKVAAREEELLLRLIESCSTNPCATHPTCEAQEAIQNKLSRRAVSK